MTIIIPFTSITMTKEWTRLSALLCSMEKVWVALQMAGPSSLIKRGKNSSTTCSEGYQGYRKRVSETGTGWLCNSTHDKTKKKGVKRKKCYKKDHFNEKAKNETYHTYFKFKKGKKEKKRD